MVNCGKGWNQLQIHPKREKKQKEKGHIHNIEKVLYKLGDSPEATSSAIQMVESWV